MSMHYVQYGCGLSAPTGWENFDASPTLRLQNLPVLGAIFKKNSSTVFPDAVKYGDIIKGLPILENSCNAAYCSHTLEHLSFEDCGIALRNTYKILKPGGIFRCVVPDLESAAREYINSIDLQNADAGNVFIRQTLLGLEKRPRGLKNLLISYFGNAQHLWMWDKYSLAIELKNAGFSSVRNCAFNDSKDPQFKLVEDKGRFNDAIALEAIK